MVIFFKCPIFLGNFIVHLEMVMTLNMQTMQEIDG